MSEGISTTRSMAYDFVANIVLEVHPNCPPADADWDAFIAWLHHIDITRAHGGLVFAEGPGPNAAQRKKLVTVPGVAEQQTVVLTTSLIARGAITALNWLGYKKLVGRDYGDLEGGLGHLGVPRELHTTLTTRVVELKCELLSLDAASLLKTYAPAVLATWTMERLQRVAASRARPSAQRDATLP